MTTLEFLDHLEELLRFKNREEMHVFGVNNLGEVTKSIVFGKGNRNRIQFNLLDLLDYVRINNVSALILAHNHPNGDCIPSGIDNQTYQEAKAKLEANGCLLLDSYILGKNGIYSMKKEGLARIFDAKIELLSKNWSCK